MDYEDSLCKWWEHFFNVENYGIWLIKWLGGFHVTDKKRMSKWDTDICQGKVTVKCFCDLGRRLLLETYAWNALF